MCASPPPPHTALVVIADDVTGAAATLVTEGSWAGGRHPLHGAVLFLIGDGVDGTLAAWIRAIKSSLLLLLLLLLNYHVYPPVPMMSYPPLGGGEG